MTFIVTRVGHLTYHLNSVVINIKFTLGHDNMLVFLYTFVLYVEDIVITSIIYIFSGIYLSVATHFQLYFFLTNRLDYCNSPFLDTALNDIINIYLHNCCAPVVTQSPRLLTTLCHF